MRYNALDELTTENDIIIYDPMTVDWSTFDWSNGYAEHQVTKFEIERPYLISYKYYNTVEYEDELLLINNVYDPFEMRVGLKLRIPNLEDLTEFLLELKES